MWSSLEPAHHGHMCMKTSNWLEGEGAWGVKRPPEPLALQVLEQTDNVKTKSSEMDQPCAGPGQWATEEKADLLNKLRLRCDRV